MNLKPPIRQEQRAEARWANRRATVRYRCAPATSGKVYVESDHDHEYQRAWINDLSHNGVGMMLQRPMPEASLITIVMKGVKSEHHLTAQVVHATLSPLGEWVVGCELIAPLSDDDLDDLLG